MTKNELINAMADLDVQSVIYLAQEDTEALADWLWPRFVAHYEKMDAATLNKIYADAMGG